MILYQNTHVQFTCCLPVCFDCAIDDGCYKETMDCFLSINRMFLSAMKHVQLVLAWNSLFDSENTQRDSVDFYAFFSNCLVIHV